MLSHFVKLIQIIAATIDLDVGIRVDLKMISVFGSYACL
jgi:hypothetical protein